MAKKYNVLYVDDESDNLLAFRSVFRRYFNVYTATNGPDAIEFLKNQPVHLILSDQRMPRMTGVEFFENIKDDYPKVVRMIVTGYAEMQPILEAVQSGNVSKYILKPWNVEELKGMIEGALT